MVGLPALVSAFVKGVKAVKAPGTGTGCAGEADEGVIVNIPTTVVAALMLLTGMVEVAIVGRPQGGRSVVPLFREII